MSKLYFYYGPMGSMKTAKALITAYNYEEKGFRVLCLTSSLDERYGKARIASRIQGLSREAIPLAKGDDVRLVFERFLTTGDGTRPGAIIVDEAQFLTAVQIEDLAEIVDVHHIDVLCYGIRTDFRTELFEGSERLMALADVINEEIAMCSCGRKATVNARLMDGKVVKDGPQVMVGGDESYQAMCRRCWRKLLHNGRGKQ